MAGTKRASDTPPDIAAETPVASDSIPAPPEPAAPDKGEEETPVIAGTELVVSVGQSIISSTLGLSLSEALDSTQWFEIGAYLGRAERKLQWVIGDWWCHGEHHYGVLLETTQEPCWRGPAYQTCANAARVCKVFEISRRRENLSFGHHEAVAALPAEKQDELLHRAESEGWSRQRLRDEVKGGGHSRASRGASTRAPAPWTLPLSTAADSSTITGFASALRDTRDDDLFRQLETFIRALRAERPRIAAIPQEQRVALVRGLMDVTRVTHEMLAPITLPLAPVDWSRGSIPAPTDKPPAAPPDDPTPMEEVAAELVEEEAQ